MAAGAVCHSGVTLSFPEVTSRAESGVNLAEKMHLARQGEALDCHGLAGAKQLLQGEIFELKIFLDEKELLFLRSSWTK